MLLFVDTQFLKQDPQAKVALLNFLGEGLCQFDLPPCPRLIIFQSCSQLLQLFADQVLVERYPQRTTVIAVFYFLKQQAKMAQTQS